MGGLSEAEKKLKISEILDEIYLKFPRAFDSKEEFIFNIENSLKENEQNFLKDKSIKRYYDIKIENIWKKIEEDKAKEIEKYKDISLKLLRNHEEEMKKLRSSLINENKKNEDEKQKKLEQMIEELSAQVRILQKRAEEENNKIQNYTNTLDKQVDENIEKYQKELETETDSEKIKEINEKIKYEKKKKEDINAVFKDKLEEIEDKKYLEICEKFKKEEKDFCKDEISSYDKTKITTFINKFLKSEKIPKYIVNYLIEMCKINREVIKTANFLNIILVGPSGVGKSTLINAILDTNVQTGFGDPQTQNIEFISSEKIPFLRLIDSKGIEKNITSGITKTFENIKKFIRSQIETKKYDNFIHIIWYCWTGTRLEKDEVDLLTNLSKTYSLEKLPVIIVYTNAAFEDEIEKAKDYIKKKLKLENEFIDVLALEKKIKIGSKERIVESHGLENLREKSIEFAKSAVKSSVFEGIREELKDKIQDNIKGITNELKNKLKKEIKNYIEKMDENTEIKELYDETKNIILNVLYKYFVLTPEKDIDIKKIPEIKCGDSIFTFTEKSIDILDNFIIDYFKEILDIYKKNLDEFISEHSLRLADSIALFQMSFKQNNPKLLANDLTNFEYEIIIKKQLHDKLNKKAKLFALKNSFQFIIEPLIEKIGEYFIELYKQGLTQKKFTDFVTDSIKSSFDEIEKKIKEYNELLKEAKEEKLEEKKDENNNENPAPGLTADDVSNMYENEDEENDD